MYGWKCAIKKLFLELNTIKVGAESKDELKKSFEKYF